MTGKGKKTNLDKSLDLTENLQEKNRWIVLGIIATMVIIISLPLYLLIQKKKDKNPPQASPKFVGAEKCMECHRPEYDKWKNSHHDLAMDTATQETVLGDFNNAVFKLNGRITKFYKKDEDFFVHTMGPEGTGEEFQITHVFGTFPLQQYLIPFPGGRLQCLTIAWDVVKSRWYALPNHIDDFTDWLHWTNPGQNWNTMCAECHLTNLKKGYDAEKDAYNTTWSQMDVSCEACHGPGSDHIKWAALPELARGDNRDTRLAVDTREIDSEKLIDICYRCHSRRASFDDYNHKQAPMDYLIPSLLTPELYFPDGQILDEVFVMGSFTQSKMFLRGVKCNDCHDVHSLALKQEGNGLCLTCHRADTYDTKDHHFHKKIHEGKQSPGDDCIKCHMPERTYMGIDDRADHSIRIPRPDLTLEYQVPNACNTAACHGDKTPEWSKEHIKKWYGEKKRPHYASILARGQTGTPGALQDLIKLSKDALFPTIVRATALSLLRNYPGPDSFTALEQALMDEQPLIRHTAISVINQLSFEKKADLIFPLLYDTVRAVRVQATLGIASIKRVELTPEQEIKFKSSLDDYVRAMRYSSDFPSGRYNLGLLYNAMGKENLAIKEYKRAIELDDHFFPAKNNLAMLYNQAGRNREAEKLLRQILEDQPQLFEISYSLGLLLAEQKKHQEAIIYLKQAAGGLPERSRVHYNLGLMLSFLKQGKDAEKALLTALSLDPENFDYLWGLADHYIKAGQPDKAMMLAEKLIELYPEQKLGHDIKAFIENLKTK